MGESTAVMESETIRQPSLDSIDLQLIEELRLDGRASQSVLGAKVGLSQTAVRRRINRLLDSGTLRVTAIVNPSVLGIEWMGIVGITVSQSTNGVAADLATIPGVGNVFIASGRFDVVVELRCRSREDFLELYEAIRAKPGVSRVESMTYLEVVKDSAAIPTATAAPSLDPLDVALVLELEKDGRLSYAELATRVDLSETAVRSRVLNLLEAGAVSITATVDRVALGVEIESAFTLRATGPARAAAKRVAAFPEVVFVAITAGPSDIIGNLSLRSREQALETIDRIRALPEVGTVSALPYLRTVREAYPSVSTMSVVKGRP